MNLALGSFTFTNSHVTGLQSLIFTEVTNMRPDTDIEKVTGWRQSNALNISLSSWHCMHWGNCKTIQTQQRHRPLQSALTFLHQIRWKYHLMTCIKVPHFNLVFLTFCTAERYIWPLSLWPYVSLWGCCWQPEQPGNQINTPITVNG